MKVRKELIIDSPDLIPSNPHPRQMSQGIFAFEYLIDLGYKPSEVVICHTLHVSH